MNGKTFSSFGYNLVLHTLVQFQNFQMKVWQIVSSIISTYLKAIQISKLLVPHQTFFPNVEFIVWTYRSYFLPCWLCAMKYCIKQDWMQNKCVLIFLRPCVAKALVPASKCFCDKGCVSSDPPWPPPHTPGWPCSEIQFIYGFPISSMLFLPNL